MACADICPKGAVSVKDTLLANNAEIDADKCINCGACYKVCQVNNPPKLNSPVLWKQGWADDASLRALSSSGGAAAALSRAFISDGGVVCSCKFEKGGFVFKTAESLGELAEFAGSRYVKSNPSGAYKAVNKLLKSGKKVLFIGLPCQVAAMRNFTGDSPALYTADLICHGSPSPETLNIFLRQSGITPEKLENLYFRDGTQFQLMKGKNDKKTALFYEKTNDKYMISFLNCFIFTENCYSCPYARGERVSDITLGDSWGSELSEDEKAKGISLLICQSEKGQELLKKSGMKLFDVDIENAVKNNSQLKEPSKKPPHREVFLNAVYNGGSYEKLIRKYYPKKCFKQWVKRILLKFGVVK